MAYDVLSSTFDLFKAQAVYAGGLKAGGDWAIRFDPPAEIKFFTVGRGSCMLALDGCAPVKLGQGDVFLLRQPAGFTLASDLSVRPVAAAEVFAGRGKDIVALGSADDVVFLGSHLSLGSAGSKVLMQALPASLHIKAREAGSDRLSWLIKDFVSEAISDSPGAESARTHLAQLIFLHILRHHMAQDGMLDAGWLRAIFDPRLGPALAQMHGNPSHGWGLEELAVRAGMSRTAFATHFKAVAGVPPLTYLTQWRMHLAEHRLHTSRDTVAAVARSVGYQSDAAFSTAYKRVLGHSPRR